ncbi:MAG: amidohydrolase family protein [Candidatus Syntrophosphaera sp.]|nr:amidohydrolase family protein [Candidatus Syntrophosphaera sp.]
MKLFHNAHFYLDDGFANPVKALLAEKGKIAKLLREDGIDAPDLEKIDLHGAYVYPGFIDAHTHCYSGGLYTAGVDLSGCRTLDEVLSLLFMACQEKDGPIFAWRFDENDILEKRFPTMRELDSVCPRANLLLRRVDGHSCVLNSQARKQVPGLTRPDEVLRGADNDLSVNWLQDNISDDTVLEAYHTAAQVALKGGFTRIHTMIGDAQQSNQHYKLIRDRLIEFPVGYELYPQSFNIRDALELGAKRIGGCILADGSIGSHTAALSHPYSDQGTKGLLYQDNAFWRDFVTEAQRHKLQVGVHCIGDAAIRQINTAYLKLGRDDVCASRHQLIHCELTPDPLMREIAASGAVPVMQPAFDLLWGGDSGFYAARLGTPRSREMNRFDSLTGMGTKVCGSSDWYITELNIAMSLHAAINHHNPAERLTPAQAIRIYTDNNAWLSHEEDLRGKIEPGFMADLSVMDTDFTQPFDYQSAATLAVIRDGAIVHAQ